VEERGGPLAWRPPDRGRRTGRVGRVRLETRRRARAGLDHPVSLRRALLSFSDAFAVSIPFDVAHATARAVQLWTDINEDPAVVHGTMVPVAFGSWSVSGQTGTVTIPVVTMEALVVGDGSTPVPGSIAPLTIEINRTTLAIQRITFSGRLTDTVLGDVDFEYALQSTPGPWILPTRYPWLECPGHFTAALAHFLEP
jgi:hypothetical protein